MSIQVANINLSAAVVGTAGSIPIGQSTPPPTLAQQMRPTAEAGPTLMVWNESGCGLTCTFPLTRETFTIPAGQWRQLSVPPAETQLLYQVIYVLPNAPVSLLLADLYVPGEQLDGMGALGNSPVNGGATVTFPDRIVDPSDNVGIQVLDLGAGVTVLLRPTAINRGFRIQTIDGAAITHTVFDAQPGGFLSLGELGKTAFINSNIGTIGGIGTTGALGMPGVVAEASFTGITSTATQMILSYQTPLAADIRFMACMTIRPNNAVSGNNITASITWTSPDNSTGTQVFQFSGGSAYVVANGATNIVNGSRVGLPLYGMAKANTTIILNYRDPTNAPNDDVFADLVMLG